mmetsp:Transcript_4443/g.13300  ORF Transcript_4443/g.13300 Transcript_4443/m.13300 type:complete len:113 (-) Transcript_4443:54-392(-)
MLSLTVRSYGSQKLTFSFRGEYLLAVKCASEEPSTLALKKYRNVNCLFDFDRPSVLYPFGGLWLRCRIRIYALRDICILFVSWPSDFQVNHFDISNGCCTDSGFLHAIRCHH